MNKGLVSVILPVYNETKYLKEAINSILNQTYPFIELIIINDGSNDEGKTERECIKISEKMARDNGFVKIEEKQKLIPGDKVYFINRDKRKMVEWQVLLIWESRLQMESILQEWMQMIFLFLIVLNYK